MKKIKSSFIRTLNGSLGLSPKKTKIQPPNPEKNPLSFRNGPNVEGVRR